MKMPKNLGMILLAIWLILFVVLTAPFLKVSFAFRSLAIWKVHRLPLKW